MATPPIALDIRPPAPVQGPLDQAQQAMSVQTLINQAALQKQAQQANVTQQQQRELELQQQQLAAQDQQTIRQLAPKFSGKDANGNGTFDLDGLATEAQSRGINPALINQMRMQHLQLVEQASKAGTAQLNDELGHNKAAYEVIEGVKGITDPVQRETAYQQGLNRLKLLKMDTSHLPTNAPNDDALTAYESSLGMHGQLLSDAKEQAETKAKEAEAASKDWKEFPALGKLVNTKTNEVRDIAGGQLTPPMMESKYVAIEQKRNMGQPLSPEERAFAQSYRGFKEMVPQFNFNLANQTGAPGAPAATVAKQFGMSPEAFDQAAEKYNSTGVLPQVGRGPNGIALQRALMNRSGELHPGAVLAANSAEYKANESSLKNIQKTFDNVTAFENTAGKNLDVFLGEAKKALDTGLPIVNLPARYVAGKLGSGQQAAFETARTTALTEIAKVLSSANAGSGVLSDSARHEVEGLIKGDATLDQIMRAASILKTDMANRHQSYADQIGDIQRRMGSKGTEASAPAQSSGPIPRPPNATHTGVSSKDGKTYWLDANQQKLGLAK